MWKIGTILAVPLVLYSFYLNAPKPTYDNAESENSPQTRKSSGGFKYWVDVDRKASKNPYESAVAVLDYMGHEKIDMGIEKHLTKKVPHYDWDLFYTWQHFTTTKMEIDFKKLKQHHRINHFPGMTKVARIDNLGSKMSTPYIPRVFKSSKELQAYLEEYPQAKIIERNALDKNSLKIRDNYWEVDFSTVGNYAQVLVQNPLLIDGHVFDFGVYVVVTSIRPLRAYYYASDVQLRVAHSEFKKDDFSSNDDATFSINDDTSLVEDFEKIDKLRTKKYSELDILKTILKEKNADAGEVFDQVEDCIDSVLLESEQTIFNSIVELNNKFGKQNFFEILRFDFYLDDDNKVYLSDVIVSPHLAGSGNQDYGGIDPAKYISRSVLYHTFNLIGVGSYMKMSYIRDLGKHYVDFIASDNQITLNPQTCTSPPCTNTCDLEQCRLCMRCIDYESTNDLKHAYLEHLNSGDMKRVSPRSNTVLAEMKEKQWNKLNYPNKFYAKWLMGMCDKNHKFC